jgi:hypothetical protein
MLYQLINFKGLERKRRDAFQCNIPTFAWTEWETQEHSESAQLVWRQKFKQDEFLAQVGIVTA